MITQDLTRVLSTHLPEATCTFRRAMRSHRPKARIIQGSSLLLCIFYDIHLDGDFFSSLRGTRGRRGIPLYGEAMWPWHDCKALQWQAVKQWSITWIAPGFEYLLKFYGVSHCGVLDFTKWYAPSAVSQLWSGYHKDTVNTRYRNTPYRHNMLQAHQKAISCLKRIMMSWNMLTWQMWSLWETLSMCSLVRWHMRMYSL